MQCFSASLEFEVLEQFNDKPGTYIKSFLISDVINLNKWQATHEANIANLDTFIGRPGIHYINQETGKRDHTGAPSFVESLQIQELYRVANIIVVGSDIASRQNWQISEVIDSEVAAKIANKEIKWISPSIWPDEDSVEIIKSTDGEDLSRVHSYKGLHYAFVDEPAYEDDAGIKAFCDGTTKSCKEELSKFTASIDNVQPLTEHKIIVPKKKKGKKQNTSTDSVNTSDKEKTYSNKSMTTEEDLRKELTEAKKAIDELEKEKEDAKKSKKAQEEEEEEEKESKAKKAQDDDEEDKKEETAALKAQVEDLTAQAKIPLIDNIISAQLSAQILSNDSISSEKSKLFKASLSELKAKYEVIKPFAAKIQESENSQTLAYMGTESSFDASNTSDGDDLLQEVMQQ